MNVDDRSHFTMLGAVLGETNLSVVEAKLGSSKHSRAGSRLDPLVSICYIGRDGTRVKFTAHADDELLSEVAVVAKSVATSWDTTCALSETVSERIMMDDGLRLGLRFASVINLLDAKHRHAATRELTYESERRLTTNEINEKCRSNVGCSHIEWWLSCWIQVAFRNDRSASFDVYRSVIN